MKLYLGNKMMGVPFFNAPWFDACAAVLRKLPGIETVFNPADHDREMDFEPLTCPDGSREEAAAAGFEPRAALCADWSWIATYSDGQVVGPQWNDSPGTISEIACHQALRLPVWEFDVFVANWGHLRLNSLAFPPIMELGLVARTGVPWRPHLDLSPGSPWRPWEGYFSG